MLIFLLIIVFGEKLVKIKIEKNSKFLKGPTTKVKPKFHRIYCEKKSKRTMFRIKKSSKLTLRNLKLITFKVWLKKEYKKSYLSQVHARI